MQVKLNGTGVDKGVIVRKMKPLISQMVKLLDARGNGVSHAKCNQALNEFIRAWDEWGLNGK